MILGKINDFIRFTGIQINRTSGGKSNQPMPLNEKKKTRKKILEFNHINKILDVGANTGQYASSMRNIGFNGDIISFEPLSSAYNKLKENSKLDTKWTCENFALGSDNSEAEINISGNSYSSSMLEMRPEHIEYDVRSQYIGKETIKIKTLNSVFDNYYTVNDNVWLKIDTQGFEKQVLEGATEILPKVKILQLEISLFPLYQNEPLFDELYPYVLQKGFELFTVENGIQDSLSGRLLQMDCIFKNLNK